MRRRIHVFESGVRWIRAGAQIVTRTIATILAATFFAFVVLEISIPGGFRSVVLSSGDTRSPRALETIEEFHLDDNVVVRWVHWLIDVMQGDFGYSVRQRAPVVDILTPRLPISLQIMLLGTLVTVLVGIPLGILTVAWANKWRGRVLATVLGVMQSIPVYITPLFLIWFFAVRQRWLPAAGWVRVSTSVTGNVEHLILPIAALVTSEIGSVARIVRVEVTRMLGEDFVSVAQSKGLGSKYVLFRHALRPASLGLLNVIGTNMGALMSGALIIELIFGIGAFGQILLESSINRDLYMLLALVTYAVVIHAVLSALIDVAMRMLDPRL